MASSTNVFLCFVVLIMPISAAGSLKRSVSLLESKVSNLFDRQVECIKRSDHQGDIIKTLKEKIAEQEGENEAQRIQIRNLQQSVDILTNRIQQLESSQIAIPTTKKSAVILRTCEEIRRSDPDSQSGTYSIDPDGDAFGDPPVTVYCNMTTGSTLLSHDSENVTEVDKCAEPGCYSRRVTYNATARQVSALVQQSRFCKQSIQFDCFGVPLEFYGTPQAWWNDWNETPQYFWSGSDSGVHTCQCGIDGNCIDSSLKCNCDSLSFVELHDYGVISAKNILPVTKLNFGRTSAPSTYGRYALGKLECSGRDIDDRMPESCADLWKIGHTLNGFFNVKNGGAMQSVYCDFSKSPGDEGLQTVIGTMDVKTSQVYFHVQRNSTFSTDGSNVTIPFNVEVVNIGNAMNLSDGTFTTPTTGTYFFAFSGVNGCSSSIYVSLFLNEHQVASTATYGYNYNNPPTSLSLISTLKLEADDVVYLVGSGSNLMEKADQRYTQFTGILLHEELRH